MATTDKGTYHKKNAIAYRECLRDIRGESIPQTVLKVHLHIERALENIIRESFERPNLLLTEKSMFSNKLSLVSALGILPHEYMISLKYFNKIRNKFSHDLNFKLEEEELIQLLNRLDSKTKETYEVFLKPDAPKDEAYIRITESLSYKLTSALMALFFSLNDYHRIYLTDPIIQELYKLHVLKKEILGKDEYAQKAYIDDRYNEIEKKLDVFCEEKSE